MSRKTIIFDFDGTLADTFPLVVDVSSKIAGIMPPSAQKIAELRQLPLLKAIGKLGISFWQSPRVILLTRPRLFARINEAPLFPGVAETLRGLHEDGYKLCVLTSNRRRNAQEFLRAHHLNEYFSDIVGVPYGNVFFKVYGLRKLLRRNHLRAKDCYYVGNETLDMHAAKLAGLHAVGTTWGGGHELAELAATEPFAIIDKPEDVSRLFK